jgi:hypothetical protein
VENHSEDKFCSFCGTTFSEESRLAGGLGAFICEHCVRRFHQQFTDEEAWAAGIVAPWKSMTQEELLQVLPEIVATGAQHDAFLRDWVDLLRERGISWHRIGLALGVTRQAAWQRFTRTPASARTASAQAES